MNVITDNSSPFKAPLSLPNEILLANELSVTMITPTVILTIILFKYCNNYTVAVNIFQKRVMCVLMFTTSVQSACMTTSILYRAIPIIND